MPHKPGVGAIFGITSEDGVAAQKRVVLMDRSSLKIVAKTTADTDGAYSFTGLNPDTNDYLVFAVDDDGAPAKDALIRDYITPIPAYQGATFIGNWTKRVLADYPVAGWLGQFDASGNPIHVADLEWATLGGTTTFAQPGLTPGATHLGAIQLDGSAFGVRARRDMSRGYSQPGRFSLEWVFRRSSATTDRQPTLVAHGTSYGDSETASYNTLTTQIATSVVRLYVALRYIHATQELVAYNSSAASTAGDNLWSAWREIGRVSVSTLPDDIHTVLTVEYGFQAKIYVNSTLLATFSLAGQNAFVAARNNDTKTSTLGCCVVGQTTDLANVVLGRATTVLTGPFALYVGKILTDAEVLARYNDLMVGTTPAETGYAKEVLIDQPMCYYRLNESDHTNGFADWVTLNEPLRRATIFNGNAITYNQPSPVTGQTGCVFAGGAARTDLGPSTSSSRRGLSFEFIHEQATNPTSDQWIVANTNEAETVHSGVFIDTNRRLNLRTVESTANTTVNFPNTEITAGVRRHITITLDKTLLQAKLYIDGVLVETVSTTGTLLDIAYISAFRTRETHIAGIVNDARSAATGPLTGYLSDVAFYSQALTASRIAAHYAAMSIA
jgi:hypothetical protein